MTTTLTPMAWTQFTLSPKPSRSEIIAIVNRLVNNGIDPKQGLPEIEYFSGGFGAFYGIFNFLLKRDIDPASNDNDPMWTNKAA